MANDSGLLFCCLPSESAVCVKTCRATSGDVVKQYKSEPAANIELIAQVGSDYLLGSQRTKPFIYVWALQKVPQYILSSFEAPYDIIANVDILLHNMYVTLLFVQGVHVCAPVCTLYTCTFWHHNEDKCMKHPNITVNINTIVD